MKMTNDFLSRVRASTEARVRTVSLSNAEMLDLALRSPMPNDFMASFDREVAIVAEIKFASPSCGHIKDYKDPVDIARQYLDNGAAALSVLTEPDYFKGSLEYMKAVRIAFPDARILMKDFVLDLKQIYQARIYGASAVLLIVAFLDAELLKLLYEEAISIGLTPLIEVHDDKEFEIAASLGAQLIGVNNRDLSTLEIDIEASITLAQHCSNNAVLVSESGLGASESIKLLESNGYRGFLIGTHFMKEEFPGKALSQLIQEVAK